MNTVTVYNEFLNQVEEVNVDRITGEEVNKDTQGNPISVTFTFDNNKVTRDPKTGQPVHSGAHITVSADDAKKINEARGVKSAEEKPAA